MRTIHTFGDSHAKHVWEAIQTTNLKTHTHHIGAKLMYTFGKEKLNLLNISDKQYNVIEGDYVCFCFGEIDCRCHIFKYKDEYQETIQNLVNNYFEAIALNLQTINVKPIVFNVLPPSDLPIGEQNPEYPHLGTIQERITYTKTMNNCLKNGCELYNYIFLDVYDSYCNKEGSLDSAYTRDRVHIKNPCHIIDFLENHI